MRKMNFKMWIAATMIGGAVVNFSSCQDKEMMYQIEKLIEKDSISSADIAKLQKLLKQAQDDVKLLQNQEPSGGISSGGTTSSEVKKTDLERLETQLSGLSDLLDSLKTENFGNKIESLNSNIEDIKTTLNLSIDSIKTSVNDLKNKLQNSPKISDIEGLEEKFSEILEMIKELKNIKNSVGMKMMYITGGIVPLTSDYQPTVSDFYISNTELTQAQWKAVMNNDGNGNAKPSENMGKGDNFPMYFVSWYDAIVFCNKLSEKEGKNPCYKKGESTDVSTWGNIPTTANTDWDAIECNWSANGYRLPTEAEWEYAARGGENFTYAGSNKIDEIAWYENNSEKKTHPVGEKKANKFGLYDMSGNLHELCWDWKTGNYDINQTTNPTGVISDTFRVMRGGQWGSMPKGCGVSWRNSTRPESRVNYLGFRVVCKVD